jgi:acylphosphatase
MSDPARLEATVRGRVQGVGFRWFVLQVADGLAIGGWVANEPDGTVRCVAETLLTALRDGPPGARVDRVDTTWMAATGAFDRFGVRSGGHSGD